MALGCRSLCSSRVVYTCGGSGATFCARAMMETKQELLESMDILDPAIAGGLMAAAVPGTVPLPGEGETLMTAATVGESLAMSGA